MIGCPEYARKAVAFQFTTKAARAIRNNPAPTDLKPDPTERELGLRIAGRP